MKPQGHSGSHAYDTNRSSNKKPAAEKQKRFASAVTKLDCLQMIEDPAYRKQLLRDLRLRTLRPAVECMLWYYAKGKPKEMVEHSGTLSLQSELAALSPEELRDRALEVAAMLGAPGKTGRVH